MIDRDALLEADRKLSDRMDAALDGAEVIPGDEAQMETILSAQVSGLDADVDSIAEASAEIAAAMFHPSVPEMVRNVCAAALSHGIVVGLQAAADHE